jgi:crotonobetainyl-CoA:carnitine CoA-transferase CaiB-like acyl-CoA transferase
MAPAAPDDDAPLGDILVVDLTRALAGPHAAMMLGDLGARVIKVESPAGDDSRTWGPPFVEGHGVRESTYFMSANRNKESVALDLKDPDDLALLRRMVARADVLLENFRVGVLDRLGLDVASLHELNPGLVIGSITGFGHDGPEAARAGYDQIAQGEGGLMSLTGETPTKTGVPIADLLAGMNLAYGVVAALHQRSRTGSGRVVRTSLLASVVGVHAYQGTMWTVAGMVPRPSGVHHPAIAPYGMYRTQDAPIQIACASDRLWLSLAGLLGLDVADARFATNLDRVTHRDELTASIEEVLATRTAEHWLSRLAELGVPAGKVRTVDDVYAWEQTRSQGLLLEVADPALGRVALPGSALRLDDNTWSGGRRDHLHPPRLDQHGEAVRQECATPPDDDP